MKIRKLFFVMLFVSFFCFSLAAQNISPNTFRLMTSAVFEVVIEKPTDDPVQYDRALDWDSVPYAIRSDKYYSIGTAFAISETELMSAFHVINLGDKSKVYKNYYIRDSKGKVNEIDQIIRGSAEKDFIIFTVKDRKFTDFLKVDRDFEIGDQVYSVGNALGEGIVLRTGLILGTVPEQESGRWNLLKSSADGNPGNSGGPLVSPDGRALALVTSLRDNILYSVPMEVILDSPKDRLEYRRKFSYGHLIIANNIIRYFETSAPLPASYITLRDKIAADYEVEYVKAMEVLFAAAPTYLAPENSAYLFNGVISSTFPEVDFVDKNDNNWKLSNFDVKGYSLPDDGRIMHMNISGFNFYKINKPKSTVVEQFTDTPKYTLDLILQTIRSDRTLWGSDRYRILSYGEPASISEYIDALGRTWITAYWLAGFEDNVLIMYILPLPNGPAVITTIQDSSQLAIYEWDIRKTCDHVHSAYVGSFSEWIAFLKAKKNVPRFLSSMQFKWNDSEKSFVFSNNNFFIAADKKVFDWSNLSVLFLSPCWYLAETKPEYGIRSIMLNRDSRGKEYTVLYKLVKPDPLLGTNAAENWNDRLTEKFPFDGTPAISAKENTGSVGAILKAKNILPNVLHSLYLSMENPGTEESLKSRFNSLKEGIQITR